ncbi:unnamed protein product [Protopolystoma xenopodis]|uniref:Uncharacterized protein n=1 Tax=Protopolystoma xenopodis TaxID=117903 RepID=A0A3S5C6A7_9PLAT|nr:unnamed protein product [Protopolystoma xenopodis]
MSCLENHIFTMRVAVEPAAWRGLETDPNPLSSPTASRLSDEEICIRRLVQFGSIFTYRAGLIWPNKL